MATMNSAQLEPTMVESIEKALQKHFEESAVITKRVKKGDVDINTRGIRVPVYIRPNPSFGWHPEAGAFATPLQTADIETKVYPVRCSAGFEFSGTYFREGKQPTAIVKGVTDYLARTQTSALKKYEQAFCATYTGELGVITAANGTTTATFAFTFANGSLFSSRKIQPGMRLAWYTSAGVQRSGGSVTLSTVSTTTPPVHSTGVVTMDTQPNDLAATDIAVFGDPTTAGSYGRAVNGLQDFVASSGVIQGQDRANYPELKSLVIDASAAALTSTMLRKFTDAYRFRTEDKPADACIVSGIVQKSIYERQYLNRIRFAPGSEAKDEITPMFGDMEWVTSPDIHDDRLYMLSFDAFRWYPLKEWGRYNEDGMDWRLYFSNGGASDKFTGWMGAEGNFGCQRFNTNFLYTDLQCPTDAALGYLVTQ